MRAMASQYEISGKNHNCLVKRVSSRAEHNLTTREKIHCNKQHFGNKSPVLPADQFLRLNVVVVFFFIYFLFMYLFEK